MKVHCISSWLVFLAIACALSVACSDSQTSDPRRRQSPVLPGTAPTAPGTTGPASGAVAGSGIGFPPAANGVAGAPGPVAQGGGAAGARSGAGPSAPAGTLPTTAAGAPAPVAAGAGQGVPCSVAPIVSQHCVTCHGAQPKGGAPMSLMTLADFQAPSKSNPARTVSAVAQERVSAADPARRMPPVSAMAIPAADLKTLGDWLGAGAGAAASGNACPISEAGGGSSTLPPATMGGSGRASMTPIEYDDPEMQCYSFKAYAQGNRDQKFSVPTTPDLYFNFIMKAPWQGVRYIRAFHNKNDNEQVIHHWILFKNTSNEAEAVVSSSGAHPDAVRLYGWSPGAGDVYFDPDVGMKAESSVSYTLEAHYNNTTGAAAADASGVEVCVTPKVPKYEIQQAWVGTDAIASTSASGTCTPTSKEQIHVIAAHPHMHKKGTHMKVVVMRADGKQDVVHDEDFAFDYQRMYLKDFVMNPGDKMTTTCTYSAPATFGTSTNSEMCYFFPVYWPAGAMVSANPLFTALHGPNTCID